MTVPQSRGCELRGAFGAGSARERTLRRRGRTLRRGSSVVALPAPVRDAEVVDQVGTVARAEDEAATRLATELLTSRRRVVVLQWRKAKQLYCPTVWFKNLVENG